MLKISIYELFPCDFLQDYAFFIALEGNSHL